MQGLEIPGFSMNLSAALFSTGICATDSHGHISNGHWVMFSGAPHFEAVKKAFEHRYADTAKRKGFKKVVDWRLSWRYDLDNGFEGFPTKFDFTTDFRKFYCSGRFGLADDRALIEGSGSRVSLSASAEVEEVDDGVYKVVASNMLDLYTEVVLPQYYLAFRKLGYAFLIGPGAWVPLRDSDGRVYYEANGAPKMVHNQQIVLLVHSPIQDLYAVEGLLMPVKEG
jgi:hypothetical protein